MDIIHSGESMAKCVSDSAKERMPAQGVCKRCGYISSMDVCKVRSIGMKEPPWKYSNSGCCAQACVLLEGLNKGLPRLGVGKSSKSLAAFKALQEAGSEAPENGSREVTSAKVTMTEF